MMMLLSGVWLRGESYTYSNCVIIKQVTECDREYINRDVLKIKNEHRLVEMLQVPGYI